MTQDFRVVKKYLNDLLSSHRKIFMELKTGSLKSMGGCILPQSYLYYNFTEADNLYSVIKNKSSRENRMKLTKYKLTHVLRLSGKITMVQSLHQLQPQHQFLGFLQRDLFAYIHNVYHRWLGSLQFVTAIHLEEYLNLYSASPILTIFEIVIGKKWKDMQILIYWYLYICFVAKWTTINRTLEGFRYQEFLYDLSKNKKNQQNLGTKNIYMHVIALNSVLVHQDNENNMYCKGFTILFSWIKNFKL